LFHSPRTLIVSVLATLLFAGSGPLRADDPPEARFAAMSPDEVRAYERETLRRVADLALIPPVPNTEPLPQYDYDKLDYGMTIGIEQTPEARLWATVCENPEAEKPAWSVPRRIWHGVMLNKPTVLSTGEWCCRSRSTSGRARAVARWAAIAACRRRTRPPRRPPARALPCRWRAP
jgi:hypothetical protein